MEENTLDFDHVHWLGHSGIKLDAGLIIYIDPYHISTSETADIILITHDHYDHFSLTDIQKIKNEDTVIVVPARIADQLSGNIIGVRPGDSIEVKGIGIEAVPAYNIGKPYHPKDREYVGYIVTIDNVRCYHAGDTDLIPEMSQLHADLAFLPVSGTYTMNAQEAAEAAEIIRPKMAVPIHWGSVAGYRTDAELFHRLSQTRSFILEQETE